MPNEQDIAIDSQTVTEPVTAAPLQPYSAKEFEVDAFSVLDTAENYEKASNELIKQYSEKQFDDPDAAKKTLATYGNDLRFKFQQKLPDFETLMQIAPIKPDEVEGATDAEKISNWEKANIEAFTASDDADRIFSQQGTIDALKIYASEARRDALGGRGDGPYAWAVDKFFRATEGAVGPFAKLAGIEEADRFLYERTQRSRDEGVAGKVASLTGAVVPFVVATTVNPVLGAATGLAQAAGEARGMYETSLKATGDEEKAAVSAALVGGAQALGVVPVGRAVSGLTGFITKQVAAEAADEAATKTVSAALLKALEESKLSYSGVAKGALEAGTLGAGGRVLANIGQNIGLDQDGDITAGAMEDFLINGAFAGLPLGAHALMKNAKINKLQEYVQKIAPEKVELTPERYAELAAQVKANGEKYLKRDAIPVSREEETNRIQLNNALARKQALEKELSTLTDVQADTAIGESGFTERSAREAQLTKINEEIATFESKVTSSGEPALFYKNEDGFYIPKEEVLLTREQEAREIANQRKTYEDYVNEEVPLDPNKITDESGHDIAPKEIAPDYEVESIPEGGVLHSDPSAPDQVDPSPFMTWFYGIAGANIELRRNVVNGANGAFYPATNKIKILRSLYADPARAAATLAHEGTHFFDAVLNNAFKSKSFQDVAYKLRDLNGLIKDAIPEELINAEGKRVSMNWRKGWDGSAGNPKGTAAERFAAYRNKPEEIYADIGSAIINRPDWVQKRYPEIYNAFEASLARNPEMSKFFSELQRFSADPSALTEFNMRVRKEAREQEGVIEAKKREIKIAGDSFQKKLLRAAKDAYQFIFGKYSIAKPPAGLEGEAKAAAWDLYNDLSRRGAAYATADRMLDNPLLQLNTEFQQTGIDYNTWAHTLFAEKVINDTTPTMDRVHADFDNYKAAASIVKKFLSEEKGINTGQLARILDLDNIHTPEQLNDALAQVSYLGDIAQVIGPEDFLNRYDPRDPRRQAKAERDYRIASEALNRRRVSIPIENLTKFVKSIKKKDLDPDIKAALEDIIRPNAFAARRYLANAGGYTINNARSDLAHIEQTLGPEKYAQLQKINKKFHDIIASVLPIIEESQLYSPDTLERIRLNKGSYVTNMVLKYFEGADNVDAKLKSAIGSLSATGNEITSTAIKTRAITIAAYRQRAENAAVKIAKAAGDVVEEIRAIPGKDIFAEKQKLSAYDKDHSYLISYDQGVPTLNKIKSSNGGNPKAYENMMKSIRNLPGADVVLNVSDELNKAFLTRQLKTVFNPSFVLGQKMMDRKMELIFSNSLYPTIGPFHLDPKARARDKLFFKEWQHYEKTGELTGALKKTIDLDGAMLQQMTLASEGKTPDTSFADAIYEAFGQKLPDETSRLEKIGQYTEKGLKKFFLADKLERIAERDELRSKVNGFRIGKELGMPDAQAATFARESFGVPDPTGGGVAAPFINRAFLFGAAHLNGLRTLGRLGRDMPKTAATQLAVRVVLPKVLLTASIGGAAYTLAFGKDTGDSYTKLLSMIATNEKQSRQVILLGAQDGEGNFHNLTSIKPEDIGVDWKPWYLRLPQSREVTAATKVLWPFIEGLGKADPAAAASGAAVGAASVAKGSVQPFLQYFYNIGEIIAGNNPTDFFRNKPILDKNTALAGNPLDKALEYGQYAASQQVPLAVPYNPFNSGDSLSFGEKALKTPVVGPLLRSMVGVSNYGTVEGNKEAALAREKLSAQIILSTGDSTKELLSMYSRAAGQISNLGKAGKNWKQEVSPADRVKLQMLTSWQSKYFQPIKKELEMAYEAGDEERYRYFLDQLESAATVLLPEVRGAASFVDKKPEAGRK